MRGKIKGDDMKKVVIGNATLYCGDCMEIMPTLGKVDAVITDPPYGISYVSAWRTSGHTTMLVNDDNAPVEAVTGMAQILKDGGAMYLATRFDVSFPWVQAITDAGLTLKTPIFWDKGNHTSGDLEGDYGAQVEIFIFAHKGRHLLRGKRHGNLWRHSRPTAGEHPTPKPVELMQRMIQSSTDKDGTVFDGFMGSGTTGVACMNLDRKFIGIEIDRRYFDIACERIERAQQQLKLF